MTHQEKQPAAEARCDGVVGHDETPSGESSAEHDPSETGHGGHAHAMSPNGDRRYLWAALLLDGGVHGRGEVVVAFVSGSLALLSDAGHMLSDVDRRLAVGPSLSGVTPLLANHSSMIVESIAGRLRSDYPDCARPNRRAHYSLGQAWVMHCRADRP